MSLGELLLVSFIAVQKRILSQLTNPSRESRPQGGMCGSTVPNIDLLQSGQFNVIPWGDTPNILALMLAVEYSNTGHSAEVLENTGYH